MKHSLIIIILFLASHVYSQTYEGTASIYHSKYIGKKTMSGQVYRHDKISAAHPFLPMGTQLEVTSLKTKRSINVTINDRMGKSSGFILDLSLAAARAIGLSTFEGITKVKIKVLK